MLWENPLEVNDTVVQANVSPEYHKNYNRVAILNAANKFFKIEYIGPAQHVPTREVYRFSRRELETTSYTADIRAGAGGATRAFLYDEGRRIKEIAKVLGIVPVPGSLNLWCTESFYGFDEGYYRAQILDVKDRGKGLDSEWALRWMRFCPVYIAGIRAFAIRFEGEMYPACFVELISDVRLRDHNITDRPVVLVNG